VLQRKRVVITAETPLLDTCGTGGDGLGTFNISSLSALVASACGATVAKHGNKAVSSRSGSADFYSALGIDIKVTPAEAEKVLRETGFAFLFAPLYHGAMRHAAVPRRELGVKTIMNLLGPLANPAGAAYQIIGVYDGALAETVARAAHLLGVKRVMVVHGYDGLDELSVAAPSTVVTVDEEGALERTTIDPAEFGMTGYQTRDLEGGDGEANAATAREILAGGGPAAIRDAVILNAAAALSVAGVVGTIAEGVERARAALAEGRVQAQLQRVVDATAGKEQEVA
jgi:anthranilate synthase/phosphoribosyltransferase